MRPANERRRYNVTLSLIGWVHKQNDPWYNNEISFGFWFFFHHGSKVPGTSAKFHEDWTIEFKINLQHQPNLNKWLKQNPRHDFSIQQVIFLSDFVKSGPQD